MAYNNFSMSSGKEKFYLKSKEPKEGFVAVPYGTEGKVTYHQYHDRIEGILTKVEAKDVVTPTVKLSFLEVTLVNGADTNRISAPLKNLKGNYTDEVKALVSALNGAEVGSLVSVSISNKKSEKDGKSYDNLNVWINLPNKVGEDGKPTNTGFIPWAEIPRAIREEDEDDGEVTWNWKPVNKFYKAKIADISARFDGYVPVGEAKSSPKPANVLVADDGGEINEKDLPF